MQKILVVLTLSGLAMAASAADVEAGKAKAAACAGCHGADGIAVNPAYPNLAGQNAQYLVAAIKAYKDGTRNNAVMGALVKALSDEDIENIAAYYQSLKK